jgi:hypothetical protein
MNSYRKYPAKKSYRRVAKSRYNKRKPVYKKRYSSIPNTMSSTQLIQLSTTRTFSYAYFMFRNVVFTSHAGLIAYDQSWDDDIDVAEGATPADVDGLT